MSYICEDQRTEASLKTWAGAHELLIISFFFWKAGNDSPMQKTSAGLLRSLLYQIVERFPDLILSLAQDQNDPQGFQNDVHGFPSIPAWTEKRLLMIFRKLISDLSSTHHLCLFIDGLDEIEGNQNHLVELLQERVRGPNMKMCLSSRPDRSFIDAFSSPAMLKLEDLTRKDIKLYVSRKLEGAWRKSPAVDDKYWVSRMIDTIVRKARGVFQWVHIVVGYQIQGLQSKDGLEELWERLDELPEEIQDLYAYMLKKIDKVHRKEVASYLQIILQVYRKPSITELTLALYERRDMLFSPRSTLPLIEIASQFAKVRQRVKLICGGLLEFRERKYVSGESEDSRTKFSSDRGELPLSTHQSNTFEQAKTTFHQNFTTRVHLIHRTAYDFLKDNQVGKEFVESNTPSAFDVYGSYIEARLAQLVILAQNGDFYHSPSSPKPAGWLSLENSVASLDPPATPAPLSLGSSIASLDPLATTTSLSSTSSVASLPGAYRRKYEPGFVVEIDVIMTLASQAEIKTNKAQKALIETIDKVVTVLDQQYLGEPSDTHWSTRWGFRQKDIDWSGWTRSRDSSCQDVPNVPFDFLCFAAYHGLHLSALDIIQTRLKRDDPNYVSVLLQLATRDSYRTSICVELLTVLLRRGANPNVLSYLGSYSVWTHFLRLMPQEYPHIKNFSATEEQLIPAARAFIESGADVNAKAACFYLDPFTWIVSGDVGTELQIFEGAEVSADVSVLAFLQDSVAQLPGLAEIRKMCIARGALWTSKSFRLYIRTGTSYGLTKRQSEDVDKLVSAWSCHRAGRPWSLPSGSLREMLLRLYHELGLDRFHRRH